MENSLYLLPKTSTRISSLNKVYIFVWMLSLIQRQKKAGWSNLNAIVNENFSRWVSGNCRLPLQSSWKKWCTKTKNILISSTINKENRSSTNQYNSILRITCFKRRMCVHWNLVTKSKIQLCQLKMRQTICLLYYLHDKN